MAAKSSQRRHIAATIAGIEGKAGADDPRLPSYRRDLRAAELEEHVRRIVDTFPPLTDDQRNTIASLLRPNTESGAA